MPITWNDRKARWDAVVTAMQADIPGFSLSYKDESAFHRWAGCFMPWTWSRNEETGKLESAWTKWYTTTWYPGIQFPNRAYVEENWPFETLEHEWVHLKDGGSFMEKLPWLSRRLNAWMFNLAYVLVLPWPGAFRAWAELRAYRRSLEIVSQYEPEGIEAALDEYVGLFTGGAYLFMWPFPGHVRGLLQRPSPYQELMDQAAAGGTTDMQQKEP